MLKNGIWPLFHSKEQRLFYARKRNVRKKGTDGLQMKNDGEIYEENGEIYVKGYILLLLFKSVIIR